MSTPFDDVVSEIRKRGFHNHRTDDHSATVSRGIIRDLCAMCEPFRNDFDGDVIRQWQDFPSPGGRARKLDLVVAEPGAETGEPELGRLRLCVENKSVVTAHRNRTNRYDDLSDVVGVLHQKKPDAVLIATVLVGVAESFLNVSDRVKPFMSPDDFIARVLPRLSSGDDTLWDEFPHAVSRNKPRDAERTVKKVGSCLSAHPEGPTSRPTTTSFSCPSLSTTCAHPTARETTP